MKTPVTKEFILGVLQEWGIDMQDDIALSEIEHALMGADIQVSVKGRDIVYEIDPNNYVAAQTSLDMQKEVRQKIQETAGKYFEV